MPLIKFSYQNNFAEIEEDTPLTWEQSEQERLQSKLDTYERKEINKNIKNELKQYQWVNVYCFLDK